MHLSCPCFFFEVVCYGIGFRGLRPPKQGAAVARSFWVTLVTQTMSATTEADKTHHREEPLKVSHSSRSLPKSSVMANNRFSFRAGVVRYPAERNRSECNIENRRKRFQEETQSNIRSPALPRCSGTGGVRKK